VSKCQKTTPSKGEKIGMRMSAELRDGQSEHGITCTSIRMALKRKDSQHHCRLRSGRARYLGMCILQME
jgi:hypothetical protein